MTELLDKTVDIKMVNLTIDEVTATVPEGTLVVDAAKMVSIDIPVFCYHPKLEPVGMCRMCLVDIGLPIRDRATGELELEEDGSPKIQFGRTLQTGCTIAVSEGMVVIGYSETVKKARQDVIEFLLTSHPLDCPVCDKGGECPLQNLTMENSVGESRFILEEKKHFAKKVPLGDLIFLDRERCIQCARCTRFQTDIADDAVIGFNQRGRSLEIVTLSDPGFDSYWSGNTTDICPVGALTTADFRFGARPWELSTAASICNQCAVGCNTTINTRREAKSGGDIVIKRVMPRQNESVNEIWMCDKGRFAYPSFEEGERITSPMIREGDKFVETTWEKAITVVSEKMKEAGKATSVFAGGRLSNEDYFALGQLTNHLGGKAVLYSNMAGGDLVAQFGVGVGTNFADLGAGDAILVVASDLEEEAPIWWMRAKQAAERGATLIVANPRSTKLDAKASHILRYSYGQEATIMLALAGSGDAKKLENKKQIIGAAEALKAANNLIVLYGSEGIGYQASQSLASASAFLLQETGNTGKTNSGLIAVWDAPNAQGAWENGVIPSENLLADVKATKVTYLVGVGFAADEKLAKAVQSSGFVVVQDLRMTDTAKLADVVLPAQAVTERDGSYLSGERRLQRFYPAIPAPAQTKPDYLITAMIAHHLELTIAHDNVANLFAEMIGSWDGIKVSYDDLAKTAPQWPIIGRDDVYYGGTSYNNTQGLGVQIPNIGNLELSMPIIESTDSNSDLTAYPITTLYDGGISVRNNATLKPRLSKQYIEINQKDAVALKIEAYKIVSVKIAGKSVKAEARINLDLEEGVVLIPRRLGFGISSPSSVSIKVS
jgi:NADH-quinone oxidoreductase subunit G